MWISLEKNGPISLVKQVYQQLRVAILRGLLKPGEKLPSTREMAGELKVSRNVILEAYELLTAEGYLYSIPNSGTYVAAGAFLGSTPELPFSDHPVAMDLNAPDGPIEFRPGLPALDLIPRKKWSQLNQAVILESQAQEFSYGYLEGHPRLRHAICRHLLKHRGVICEPDQIIITHGTFQSFAFLSKMFLGPGVSYVVEDPLHWKVHSVLAAAGGTPLPVPVDEWGLRTAELPETAAPAFVMVTPSHQYPLGGCMPIQRRIELIRYARAKQSLIIEDDYDSEFRYEGAPVSSLQGLDPERVIYLGSFSKNLFPGLRLGYLIPPWPIWWKTIYCKTLNDSHSHVVDQLVLARFIEEGWLERHIARMRKAYLVRRNTLIASLNRVFGDRVRISGKSTGLHLVVTFDRLKFTPELTTRIYAGGVKVVAVAEHATFGERHWDKLILGYSHLTPEQIEAGVKRLGAALGPYLSG